VRERRRQWLALDSAYRAVLGRSASADPGAVLFHAKWRAERWSEHEAVSVRLTRSLCHSGEYLTNQGQFNPAPGRPTHAPPCVPFCTSVSAYAKNKAPAACAAAGNAAAASAATALVD